MSLEIRYDDIKEIQISLRKEAGLASYNPEDPELPNLPSADDSISQLDPSPDCLRCKHCKGRLLRGITSIICVFCGRQQHVKDVPPQPIKFLSTFGYCWFIQSLDLDGSELVELPFEANESKRGQNTRKDELALSDLLDLEIRWSSEYEKLETSVSNKTTDQKLSALKLAGVDLDNYFGENEVESVSIPSGEQFAQIQQNDATFKEDGSFQTHGRLNLSEKIQPSETVVKSGEDESGDTFSGWEANFQSAGSGTQHQESELSDPFAAFPSVDLSAHMDSFSGSNNENIAPSASNTDDWFNGGPCSDSKSLAASQAEQFKVPVSHMEGGLMENTVNSSPVNIDCIQDNQWQNASGNIADNKFIDEDDDSSDAWNDFTSSPNMQASSNNSPSQVVNHTMPSLEQASEVNFFGGSNQSLDFDYGSFSQADFLSGKNFDETGSKGVMQPETSVSDRLDFMNRRGEIAEEAEKGSDVYNGDARSKADDVERSMSQMHDLSFMLESNLSMPQKRDPQNEDPCSSFSKD